MLFLINKYTILVYIDKSYGNIKSVLNNAFNTKKLEKIMMLSAFKIFNSKMKMFVIVVEHYQRDKF